MKTARNCMARTTQTIASKQQQNTSPHQKTISSVETLFYALIDWIVDRLMMWSETQQHSSCEKRDVELAPMQVLSRISGAMYHASTSPFVLAAL